MSDTRTLLAKISALRQRLDQAQGLVSEARSAADALIDAPTDPAILEQTIRAGHEHDLAMDVALHPVGSSPSVAAPTQLSVRARRVLERGRELLGQLRELADHFGPPSEGRSRPILGHLYQDTVAMIDTALRTVALLPDSMAAQMKLCKGLEVTLEEVAGRLRTLLAGNQNEQLQRQQIDRLASLLLGIDAGRPVELEAVRELAEEILAEARSSAPLHFLTEDPECPPRFVACHSLTVARVLARVVRHDSDLRGRPQDALVAALLHDVGMLGVPAKVLTNPEPLTGQDRRLLEAHVVVGSQQLGSLFPDAPWLADAVGSHHERLDGTGYPDGIKGNRIRPLSRLLAVCDVYAAFCCPRPHRPARPTRTALADTLLLADQGLLDRACAECLLSLSFYPVGSVVELAHGAIAVVVATPPRADLNSPARPVLALLTDSAGQPLPRPQHLDLAEADQYSIVRPLSAPERRELLGRRFPQWAA